jgi:hypothetical protein
MKVNFDLNPGYPNYGRKVDLQFVVEKYEINNSEFKASGASGEDIKMMYSYQTWLHHTSFASRNTEEDGRDSWMGRRLQPFSITW